MTTEDIMKYCFFYKGETIIPSRFVKKNEGKLWVAEKYICEDIPNLIDKENPRRSIASYIAAYVGKWAPFNFMDIMATYFKKSPDVKDFILRTYS
ncbi:hypothetical protein [uncultured Prevotellamassilia sp.]|mgnify:FL=1|uniref:hypothetical protein n=1 Tax=uncultured Prevotellamassilia sp. TaxID=1926676 RepID=UPI00258BFE77|nr:hypothetical protein [uncultured Prevotellamassilia sp.]